MAIKQYGYFKRDKQEQKKIDKLLMSKMKHFNLNDYYKVLNDMRKGRIEYEPIEFYSNGIIGIIVRSDVLSKGEISFRTRQNNILRFDAAYVSALIAQALGQGWLFYVSEDKAL